MAVIQVHNAIVTRNTDPDEGVNLRGAIYFDAPTLYEGEYPIKAEPCFPMASDIGAGFFFVPKVGDEVEILIACDDKNSPYDSSDVELPEPRWRCGIYSNAADIGEEFKTNYPFRMGWKSNSGHLLMFDDFEGQEVVRLAHTLGTFIEMLANGSMQQEVQKDFIQNIYGQLQQEIGKSSTQKFRSSRNIEVTGDNNESIGGNRSINVGSSETYNVDGNQEKIVGGDYTENVGNYTQEVNGGADIEIAGGHKKVIAQGDMRAVLGDQNITVGGKKAELIAQEHETTYGVGSKETIVTLDKTFELLLGNFVTSIVAGNFDMSTVAGTINFANALAKFAIDIAGGVEVGNNIGKLAINPAGISDLSGTLVTINGGVGPVITTVTAPLVDLITGVPHVGVPTFLA